jgi:hypothetical protein
MKRYRLIKIYPGSPELGYVFNPNTISDEPCNLGTYNLYSYVKNHPLYWEEVIDSNYIILKIQTNVQGRISDFSKDWEEYVKATLKCAGTSIHSIRRLSDNAVFTVGDKIRTFGTILSIKSEKSGIVINTSYSIPFAKLEKY